MTIRVFSFNRPNQFYPVQQLGRPSVGRRNCFCLCSYRRLAKSHRFQNVTYIEYMITTTSSHFWSLGEVGQLSGPPIPGFATDTYSCVLSSIHTLFFFLQKCCFRSLPYMFQLSVVRLFGFFLTHSLQVPGQLFYNLVKDFSLRLKS